MHERHVSYTSLGAPRQECPVISERLNYKYVCTYIHAVTDQTRHGIRTIYSLYYS